MLLYSDLLKKRRSVYALGNSFIVPKEKIIHSIEEALQNVPSAFNSQSSRLVLLFGDSYQKLWEITALELRKKVSEEQFQKTKEKLNSFSKGLGSILFYEDTETISSLQIKFPLYKDQFPIWSEHGNAILQYAVWLYLTDLGLGANLQHYNPLIDKALQEAFQIPSHWRLIAQMNFGSIEKEPDSKTSLPIDMRFSVFE